MCRVCLVYFAFYLKYFGFYLVYFGFCLVLFGFILVYFAFYMIYLVFVWFIWFLSGLFCFYMIYFDFSWYILDLFRFCLNFLRDWLYFNSNTRIICLMKMWMNNKIDVWINLCRLFPFIEKVKYHVSSPWSYWIVKNGIYTWFPHNFI